jgi:subtilase family serine protease
MCTSTVATDDHGKPLTFTKPDAYSVPGVNGTVWGFGPKDYHVAYNLPWYSNVQQTIGIVLWGDDPTVKKDLDAFNSAFGLGSFPSCTSWTWAACFVKVNQRGYTAGFPPVDTKGSLETSLDVQYTHAMCLNCRIILVEADSNKTADLAAAENMAYRLGATEINNSWSAPEGSSDCTAMTSTYASAFNHPGVAVVASSGDFGWEAQCPADLNTVVAVGGTDLFENSDLSYSYETVYDDGYMSPGSGCSSLSGARSFQTSTLNWSQTGCGSKRGIADVSASFGGAWIYDSTAGYNNNPLASEATGNSYWYVLYGTSLSAPIITGTYALAGNAWTVSYPAQLAYQHTISLHDVTIGSNGFCGTTICQAARGYDGPTGVGSPRGLGGF